MKGKPGLDLIDADDEQTWPSPLLASLQSNRDAIGLYHARRREIDRAAEEDVILRVNRPSNPHMEAWREVISIAERSVSGAHILGRHATRLTAQEAAAIKAGGLEPLSAELVHRRLTSLREAGHIDDEDFRELVGRHQARDTNRSGMIWFVFTKDCLREDSGIDPFFRSWGGEALYGSHPEHSKSGQALRIAGRPAIVEAAVSCDELETFMSVGERLVHEWCARHCIPSGHGAGFEGYLRTPIPGASIRAILLEGDGSFERLRSAR